MTQRKNGSNCFITLKWVPWSQFQTKGKNFFNHFLEEDFFLWVPFHDIRLSNFFLWIFNGFVCIGGCTIGENKSQHVCGVEYESIRDIDYCKGCHHSYLNVVHVAQIWTILVPSSHLVVQDGIFFFELRQKLVQIEPSSPSNGPDSSL